MSIDTITIQSFIALAEAGSFTKAGKRVGLTQSAISQQISKLEKMLNKNLLIRGKNFALTAEGEVFLSYARQIFSLHREVLDRFTEPDLEGEVRFGLPENFASVYLEEILVDFSRIHPRILLSIDCDLTVNLFDKFKRKELDIVLVKMNRPEDLPNGVDVVSQPLRWVGASDFTYSNKPVPLILSPQPCVYRTAAIKALEEAGLPWRLVFSSSSYTSSVAAVKIGMGITVMPNDMIPAGLKLVEGTSLPSLPDAHLSLLKDRLDCPVINTLEEFLLKKLKN